MQMVILHDLRKSDYTKVSQFAKCTVDLILRRTRSECSFNLRNRDGTLRTVIPCPYRECICYEFSTLGFSHRNRSIHVLYLHV